MKGYFIAVAFILFSLTSCRGGNLSVADIPGSMYIYGPAAEGLTSAGKFRMCRVYDGTGRIEEGAFEVFLEFSPGEFTLTDEIGTIWELSADGTVIKGGSPTVFRGNGIFRLRVCCASGTWSAVKINSICFRSFFGNGQTVTGEYQGLSQWKFSDIALSGDGPRHYRFDVDSDDPAELACMCSVSDRNDGEPDSYRSSYQYVRTLGEDGFASLSGPDDAGKGAFMLKSSDKGTAEITLYLTSAQPRYIHYVEVTPPGPPAAFMGDSITENWRKSSTGHPEFFSDNGYLNKGISGQNSTQMLSRFKTDIIDNVPQCVVICCGTNDIAGNGGETTNEYVMGNIASMAEMASDAGIKVILCSLLPCNHYYWTPSVHPEDRITDLNARIKAYAFANGHGYVDYYTPMVDAERGLDAAYTSDRCHPNKDGYSVMEALVKPAIEKAIK